MKKKEEGNVQVEISLSMCTDTKRQIDTGRREGRKEENKIRKTKERMKERNIER